MRKNSGFSRAITDADRAELDVVCWVLVDEVFTHRPSCSVCSTGGTCRGVRSAIEVALDWWRLRRLLSEATRLRRLEDDLEEAA